MAPARSQKGRYFPYPQPGKDKTVRRGSLKNPPYIRGTFYRPIRLSKLTQATFTFFRSLSSLDRIVVKVRNAPTGTVTGRRWLWLTDRNHFQQSSSYTKTQKKSRLGSNTQSYLISNITNLARMQSLTRSHSGKQWKVIFISLSFCVLWD